MHRRDVFKSIAAAVAASLLPAKLGANNTIHDSRIVNPLPKVGISSTEVGIGIWDYMKEVEGWRNVLTHRSYQDNILNRNFYLICDFEDYGFLLYNKTVDDFWNRVYPSSPYPVLLRKAIDFNAKIYPVGNQGGMEFIRWYLDNHEEGYYNLILYDQDVLNCLADRPLFRYEWAKLEYETWRKHKPDMPEIENVDIKANLMLLRKALQK